MTARYIVWISPGTKADAKLVGGKGFGLLKLANIGVKVPEGFILTTKAYRKFVEANRIDEYIEKLLARTKLDSIDSLREVEIRIRRVFAESPIPSDIVNEMREAYVKLAELTGEQPLLAVRSSAVAEDLEEASFAGQQETVLGVKGFEELLEAVKRVWSSLYTARAIAYRHEKGIPQTGIAMAVVVQRLVKARSAGVAFTVHPATGSGDYVVVEASWGLGESVVSGEVTPDVYVIERKSLSIVEKRVSIKKVAYVVSDGRVVRLNLDSDKASKPSISDEEAIAIASQALLIEDKYGKPVDVEWAIDEDGTIYVLQARYETVWSRRGKSDTAETREEQQEPRILVKGLPASPGVAVGTAKVILSLDSPEAKSFQEGDVLVTRMTDPDWVPLMRKAAAIVTDEGGMTSHAAIVSRELGIPAVVGAKNATKIIKTGMLITVDGSKGVVYEGKHPNLQPRRGQVQEVEVALPKQLHYSYPVTATKIYMNLGEPEAIHRYLHLPFDGIGLMRIEFILSSWIGYHPLYAIEVGKADEYVEKLAKGIGEVASAIHPRPVIVRFSDFKTNEYRKLKGGEKYEPDERNPMLGWRGVSRYIHPKFEKAFRLEVKAVLKVREEMGLDNVWVMLPFVRTVDEVAKVLKIMEEEGLRRTRDMKVWIMAEVPSVVLLAEEFAKYVDGFSIGSNDLTQLVLGVDRDSALLAEMGYFDERDPAVLRAIAMLIEKAHRLGRTVSICGQAPSVYPEVVEFLVEHGIDSISVNPDAVVRTRMLVASVERKIMLRKLATLEKLMEKRLAT